MAKLNQTANSTQNPPHNYTTYKHKDIPTSVTCYRQNVV